MIYGIEWTDCEIVSEPYIMESFRGWVNAVDFKDGKGETRRLYIGAKSLYDGIKDLWTGNERKFIGLKFRFRKAFDKRTAPFEIQSYDSVHAV